MRALVLGAPGLLGQDLCAALVVRGHEAFGCSRGEADITKDDAVTAAIARSGATHVFNCAAYTQVDKQSKRVQAVKTKSGTPGTA